MEDIYTSIFDLLSTKEYLNFRCVSNYFNNFICNNKYCSRAISITAREKENVTLLKFLKIRGLVYNVDLCEDVVVTNDEMVLLSFLTILNLGHNKNIYLW
jgi:hypothetical protein